MAALWPNHLYLNQIDRDVVAWPDATSRPASCEGRTTVTPPVADGQRRLQIIRARSAGRAGRRDTALDVRWRRALPPRRILRNPCARHVVPEGRRLESRGLHTGGHESVQTIPRSFRHDEILRRAARDTREPE